MDDGRSAPLPAFAVAILSDDDDDDAGTGTGAAAATDVAFCSPLPPRPKKKRHMDQEGGGGCLPPPTLLVIDDDPTPQKHGTPSFASETPLSPVAAFDPVPFIVKCSLARSKLADGSSDRFAGEFTPTLLVTDDDPTPQKQGTSSFVPETPLSTVAAFDSVPSIVKCSLARAELANGSSDRFAGIDGVICLESDDESELDVCMMSATESGTRMAMHRAAEHSQLNLSSNIHENWKGAGIEEDCSIFFLPKEDSVLKNYSKDNDDLLNNGRCGPIDDNNETSSFIQIIGDSQPHTGNRVDGAPLQSGSNNDGLEIVFNKADVSVNQMKKDVASDTKKKNNRKAEANEMKRQLKEEKLRLLDERKRQKQQEKLQKESLKAEAAEAKKLEKQRKKWEKGKFALKSMVAEIDAKIVENGSVGGHLLSRFAEKGLSFRITSNPIQKSILWKMNVPDEIAELPSLATDVTDVPYILIIHQAEEFCDLVNNKSLFENVRIVQSQYPTFTICYLTNKLMSYINKCEQTQYKNPSSATSSWRRPAIEEVLSKLATHYSKVHSRQCIDEAELAETVVGLTCSLANCQFRKKLTWLSVHGNGSIIPENFVEKDLIRKNVWLKALISIPKVQPRYAIAIWKKYPTMRSLLNVYMDPKRSVHEKEFLLKDLVVEGLLGNGDKRLGEICSKRVYRVLMAQAGGITIDDAEDGADFFHC